MASPKGKTWVLIAIAGAVLLLVGVVVGFRLAVGVIKDKVVMALGPGSEIQGLHVGWSSVAVEGLRIKGTQGWPAVDTLRAERVVIVPSLRSLLSDQIQVSSVTVVKPYLSALRTRDGKLRVVPSLLEGPAAAGPTSPGPPARTARISRITLEDGVGELFDATVAQPPHKLRLEQIQVAVQDVVAPGLTGKSRFDLTGLLKGVQRDGRVTVSGWIEVASKDSSVKTTLRSVDLVALQPYLARVSDTRVQKGVLDLDLQSDVNQHQLKAPGKLIISDLEFAPGRGAMDTFLGVPRDAVVNFLKTKDNKIEVQFVIEGDINNPQFALNEAFTRRVASAMAETLGVSLRGVAEGVGSLAVKGAEAAGKAAKSVGSALEQIFGGPRKR